MGPSAACLAAGEPHFLQKLSDRNLGNCCITICICIIYIYIYGTPPQRPRFSYINIQSGRWGSQSEIDGMGLRVGFFEFRVKDLGSIAFQITNRYIRQKELAVSY